MDIAALRAAIRSAFPERPLPSMTLRQGQLADQSMSSRGVSDEGWQIEGEKDRDVIWTAIDDATLEECDAALSHLDEEGFIYYLPAFVDLAARQLAAGVAEKSDHFSSVVFHLTHISDNYALARLKRLTDAQIQVVTEFLCLVRDHGGFDAKSADAALRLYWETPEAHRRTLIYVP